MTPWCCSQYCRGVWPAAFISVDTQQIGPKYTTSGSRPSTHRVTALRENGLMVTNEGLEQLAQPLSQIVVS